VYNRDGGKQHFNVNVFSSILSSCYCVAEEGTVNALAPTALLALGYIECFSPETVLRDERGTLKSRLGRREVLDEKNRWKWRPDKKIQTL
jgi:hypothetical protein